MASILLKQYPVYDIQLADFNKTIDTPPEFKSLGNTKLVKSLLQYDMDIYANWEHKTLGPKDVFKHKDFLRLSFTEPFDNFNSMSIIEIWGDGLKESLSKKKLLTRLSNMYEYEDLLKVCYYSDTIRLHNNKITYLLYDPKEVEKYTKMAKARPGTYAENRIDLDFCGMIHTNAILTR